MDKAIGLLVGWGLCVCVVVVKEGGVADIQARRLFLCKSEQGIPIR